MDVLNIINKISDPLQDIYNPLKYYDLPVDKIDNIESDIFKRIKNTSFYKKMAQNPNNLKSEKLLIFFTIIHYHIKETQYTIDKFRHTFTFIFNNMDCLYYNEKFNKTVIGRFNYIIQYDPTFYKKHCNLFYGHIIRHGLNIRKLYLPDEVMQNILFYVSI
jgi:hypothetical protein